MPVSVTHTILRSCFPVHRKLYRAAKHRKCSAYVALPSHHLALLLALPHPHSIPPLPLPTPVSAPTRVISCIQSSSRCQPWRWPAQCRLRAVQWLWVPERLLLLLCHEAILLLQHGPIQQLRHTHSCCQCQQQQLSAAADGLLALRRTHAVAALLCCHQPHLLPLLLLLAARRYLLPPRWYATSSQPQHKRSCCSHKRLCVCVLCVFRPQLPWHAQVYLPHLQLRTAQVPSPRPPQGAALQGHVRGAGRVHPQRGRGEEPNEHHIKPRLASA